MKTTIKEFKKKDIFGIYEVSTDGFIYKRKEDGLHLYCDWTDVPWMFIQIVPEMLNEGGECRDVFDLISALKKSIDNKGYHLTLNRNET